MNSEQLQAAIKTAKNAEALLMEATLLARYGRWARCYALAHLAREEVAKAQLLRELPDDANLQKAAQGMRDHRSKLAKSAEVFTMNEEESSDSRAVVEGARQTSGVFNDLKNRSLYADFYDGGYWMPSEYIPVELAERTLKITQFAVSRIQGALECDMKEMRRRRDG